MVCTGKTEKSGSWSAIFCCAVLSLSVLASSACSKTTASTSSSPSGPITLNIGFPNVTGQDPLRGIQQAARLISLEGLVSQSRDGHAIPRLAEKWSNSADGLTWTIQIRANAFFHDGSPVNSRAVKQSLERSLAGIDRDLAPGLADIATIETPTSVDVVIRLRERSTFLLDDLTVAITKVTSTGTTVGTGPYLTADSSDRQIAMEAFPRYYRGAPSIARVVWKPYPTVRTAWAAMMRGEVDFLYEVGQDAREFIQGETSVRIFPFLRNYVYAIIPNSKKGTLRDWRIRKALSYAVNRPNIVQQAFKGHARPTGDSAWPEHWAFDSTAPSYSYDPAKASALLDAARIQTASSSVGGPPARLHFTCLFPENLSLWERMALLVQRDLSAIGVDMQLQALPIDQFNKHLETGEFDAVLLELIVGNSASRPFTFWYSQSKGNVWGYQNPNMDRALDGIRRAADDREYREAFRKFQIETLDSPPAVFLALGERSRAVSRRFQVIAPTGTDILPTISDWRLADDATRMTN